MREKRERIPGQRQKYGDWGRERWGSGSGRGFRRDKWRWEKRKKKNKSELVQCLPSCSL